MKRKGKPDKQSAERKQTEMVARLRLEGVRKWANRSEPEANRRGPQ